MLILKRIVLCLLLVSCGTKLSYKPTSSLSEFSSVEIKTIVNDSTLNVRALEIINGENALAFLTSNGQLGIYSITEDKLNYPIRVSKDSLVPNFRSLSARNSAGFGLSIGNPARMYQLDKKGGNNVVYEENHPKVFYDSLEFWNDLEGIAIGDPTDDCMSIIITRDGGKNWRKISCENLPKARVGEAAFAASDTNIAIVGDKTWVATGGKTSRVLYSPDKGKTWQIFDIPIVQGLETTGIYSIDFYDELNGFAIGGDYTKPEANAANKIITNNGGKTWRLVAENKTPGYRSCVKYIPNSNAKALVAVGFEGIDYSNDSGKTWSHLSDESFYTIRFLNDSIAYAAGNKRVSKLHFK